MFIQLIFIGKSKYKNYGKIFRHNSYIIQWKSTWYSIYGADIKSLKSEISNGSFFPELIGEGRDFNANAHAIRDVSLNGRVLDLRTPYLHSLIRIQFI